MLGVGEAGTRRASVPIYSQSELARLVARQPAAVARPTSTLTQATSQPVPLQTEFAIRIALEAWAGHVQRQTSARLAAVFRPQKAKWTSLSAGQARTACFWCTLTSTYPTSVFIPRMTKIAPVPTIDLRTMLRFRQTPARFASVPIPHKAILTRLVTPQCWTVAWLAAALAQLTFLPVPFQTEFAGQLSARAARTMSRLDQTVARLATVYVHLEAKLALIVAWFAQTRT